MNHLLIVSIASLLVLIAIGVHIAIALLIVGLFGTATIIGMNSSLSLLGQTMYYSIASYGFLVIPLFILMGAFASRAGFAKRAYEGFHKAMGRIPGSLGIATCFACAAFGAVSGSSLATAALFGKIALPEMVKCNYKKSFALGTIASAGTFASMIPPSAMFIIYAIFTDQSIGKLFMAGIIPGVITAIVYALSIIVRVHLNPELAPIEKSEEKLTSKEKLMALIQTWPIALLAFLVLGGIYTGIFTATEAAAIGAMATLALGFLQGKIRSLSSVKEALRESAKTSAMVFLIIIAALFFARFLAISRIPVRISQYIQVWDVPRVVVLFSILGVYFILGTIIVGTGIFALTLPVIFPVIVSLGYDPIWFGVISIKLFEIAAVTPPVGLNVYALKSVAGKETPVEEVFAGVWPFVVCDLIVVVLLILFPQIALFLPNLMVGK